MCLMHLALSFVSHLFLKLFYFLSFDNFLYILFLSPYLFVLPFSSWFNGIFYTFSIPFFIGLFFPGLSDSMGILCLFCTLFLSCLFCHGHSDLIDIFCTFCTLLYICLFWPGLSDSRAVLACLLHFPSAVSFALFSSSLCFSCQLLLPSSPLPDEHFFFFSPLSNSDVHTHYCFQFWSLVSLTKWEIIKTLWNMCDLNWS